LSIVELAAAHGHPQRIVARIYRLRPILFLHGCCTIYRLKTRGTEIFRAGPAPLIAITSAADALVIAAACPRSVRITESIFRNPARARSPRMKAIPVAPAKEDAEATMRCGSSRSARGQLFRASPKAA
jgi:hypothetical protein